METADRTLWTSWRARRDEGAFETLVRPHLGFAVDLARRMGCSAADAEDVVQEALVRLAREEGERPVEVGLRAWIGRVVSLRSRMLRRESARRRRHERAAVDRRAGTESPSPAAGTESPSRVEGEAPRTELGGAVERALAELPEPQREAVALHHLHDLDYAAASHVLGISENACRIRVHRGIERLRARLGAKAPAALAALPLASPPAHPEAFVASALGQAATPGLVLGTLGGVLAVKQIALLGVAAVSVAAAAFVAGRITNPVAERRDAIAAEQAAAESGGAPALAAAEPPPAPPPAAPAASPAPTPPPRAEPGPHAALLGAIYASGGRVGVRGTERRGTAAIEWFDKRPDDLGEREVIAVQAENGTVAWISELAAWPRLASLELSRHKDLDLSRLPVLPDLAEVELDRMPLSREAISYLSRQPRLTRLRVGNTKLDDDAVRAIAGMSGLTSLRLRDLRMPEGSVAHLAALARLRELALDRVPVTDDGLAALARLASLEDLDLSGTEVGARGLGSLATLPNLGRLTLEDARVGDDAMPSLLALKSLRSLDLAGTAVGDAGVAALVPSRLVRLGLEKTKVTDAVFDSLARIPSLENVDVGDTGVTEEAIARFKTQRPGVRVRD